MHELQVTPDGGWYAVAPEWLADDDDVAAASFARHFFDHPMSPLP